MGSTLDILRRNKAKDDDKDEKGVLSVRESVSKQQDSNKGNTKPSTSTLNTLRRAGGGQTSGARSPIWGGGSAATSTTSRNNEKDTPTTSRNNQQPAHSIEAAQTEMKERVPGVSARTEERMANGESAWKAAAGGIWDHTRDMFGYLKDEASDFLFGDEYAKETERINEEAKRLYGSVVSADAPLSVKNQSGRSVLEDLTASKTEIDGMAQELDRLEAEYKRNPSEAVAVQYDELVKRYNQAIVTHNDMYAKYEPQLTTYNDALNTYNAYVSQHGDRITAPVADEYSPYRDQLDALDADISRLNGRRGELSRMLSGLDRAAVYGNAEATKSQRQKYLDEIADIDAQIAPLEAKRAELVKEGGYLSNDDILGGLGYGAERAGAALLGVGEGVTDFLGTTFYGTMEGITSLGGLASNPVSRWMGRGYDAFAGNSITQDWEKSIYERYRPTPEDEKITGFTQSVMQVAAPIMAGYGIGTLAGVGSTAPAGSLAAVNTAGRSAAATKAVFGSMAAGRATSEAHAEGASHLQSLTYGWCIGAMEMTIEEISGSIPGLPDGSKAANIVKKIFSDPRVHAIVSNPVVSQLIGGLGESGEEALSAVFTPYIKRAIYDPNAALVTADEITEQALMGGLASLCIGAGINIPAFVVESINARNSLATDAFDAEVIQAIIETGLESPIDTNSYKLATELKQKQDTGESLSSREVLALYQENVAQVNKENANLEATEQETAEQETDPLLDAAREAVGADTTSGDAVQAVSEVSSNDDTQPTQSESAVEVPQNAKESVRETSEFGEYGTKVLNDIAEQTGEAVEAVKDRFKTAYQLGRMNTPRERLTFDNEVQRAAYEAGRKDAVLAGDIGLENGGMQVYNGNQRNAGTEGMTNEVHLRNGSQWAGSPYSGGQVPGVAESAGGNQSRKAQGRPADSAAASLAYGKRVSTASFGIAGGSRQNTIKTITGADTPSMAKARQAAKARGLRVVFFAGNNLDITQTVTLKDGTKQKVNISARAYISGDRVFVRVDHPRYTADQIMRHEIGHDMIAKGEVDPKTVRERIDKKFGSEKAQQLADMYSEAYAGTGMTAEEIWDEVICDSLGDMNIFSETKSEGDAWELLTATKEASADAKAETGRGPPATEGKTSRETGRRAQRGRSIELETMENNRFERLRQFGDNLPKVWYAHSLAYLYVYENVDFMNYRIIRKVPNTNQALSDAVIKEVNKNAFRTATAFDLWFANLRSRTGRHRGSNHASANGGAAVGNGGVSGNGRAQSAGQNGSVRKSGGTDAVSVRDGVSDATKAFLEKHDAAKRLQQLNKKMREHGLSAKEKSERAEIKERYHFSRELDVEASAAINQSMTMQQAKEMIQRAFILGDIKTWFDGAYKNGDEWARGEGAADVAVIVDNEWSLQEKYLNKIQGVMDGDFYAEDIIEAYLAGTLTGQEKQNTTKRLELSNGIDLSDNRFYAPKHIAQAQETYGVANQKVTNKNRDAVYKARADVVMFAHTKGAAEALGLTQTELNKKLSTWARYTARARETSERFNAGVAEWNKWTGIENSNVLTRATVSNEDLERLVGEITGDNDGFQRKYIMRTMLALDTHIDYTGLNFRFVGQPDPNNRNVNGLYSNGERTITVKRDAPHTVAHEMGHYLDYQWARDVGVGGALTERFGRDKITDRSVKQWVTNFDNFKESLEDAAVLHSGYTMDSKEVFARFVDRFVQWVNFTANGEQDRALRYNDKFTAKHYIEFVRLLQEKAALDGKKQESAKFSRELDVEGRVLSEGQQEFFKDSKVRDERGNLMVMYHGTHAAGFHVFDARMSDDHTSFFFTDSKNVATSYSSTTEEYAPKALRTAADVNNLFYEFEADGMYEVKEENGKFVLYDSGEAVAESDSAAGIYDEFREWSGIGYGNANYKVYLNLTNPLIVDAKGEVWSAIKVPEELQKAVKERFGFNAPVLNTRQYAELANAMGYDGVIFKNIRDNGLYSNGGVGASTVAVAFKPEQIKSVENKSPTSNTDIRFSLELDTVEQWRKDYAKLEEVNRALREQFKVTKLPKVDKKSMAGFTKTLLKDWSSKADFDETNEALTGLYTFIQTEMQKDEPNLSEMEKRANEVAESIIESSVEIDDEMWQMLKDVRTRLRKTGVSISPEYSHDLMGYENLQDFRRKNIGRIKISKDGLPVDVMYQSLASEYPDLFDETRYTTQPDQLVHMAEVLEEMKPVEVNPYSHNMREAATWLATDIMHRIYELPQAKPTFADKAQQKLTEQKEKDKQKLYDTVTTERMAAGRELAEQKRMSQQKLTEQREKMNERISKIVAENRERMKAVQIEERVKREAAVKKVKEHYKAKESKASESQKEKILRAQILRHTAALSKKLLHASDKNHIPQQLQGAVAKLLECINLESNYTYDPQTDGYKKNDQGLPTLRTKLFASLRNIYTNMANELTIDPDLLGDDGLLSEVVALADKRLADMNLSELGTVLNTIRAIEASIQSANIAFNQSKWETISEAADALRMDNISKKDKVELDGPFGLLGKAQKLTGLDMMTPEAFFHRLGKSGEAMFRLMRDAQDDHIRKMKAVADFTKEQLKGVNVRKLESQMHTVTLGGQNVKLSTAQIMELYALMRREQAREHIMIGGILPDVVSQGNLKKISRAKPVRGVQISEMAKAFSLLTEEQKRIAETLQEYASTQLSAWGNEAAMKVYNYEKFNEKMYWPIRVNKQETNSNVQKDTQVTSVPGLGFTKGTKPHANNSVMIGSIFDTFSTHASEMATYAAWLAPMEDINRIRNFTFKSEGYAVDTVKAIIDMVHGKAGTAYLSKLLADLSNGVKGTHGETAYMSGLVGNYKAASVGANLRVIIQQPTAILRALDMIDPKYLAAGMRPENGWKKAVKYAPIAQWKDWGYFDINTGRQMKDVLFDSDGVLDKVKSWSMAPAGFADSLAWGMLWNAVETETKHKRTDLKPGTEAFYKAVAERFTEIVDRTQVVDGILQRSQIMRSADSLTKMATSFMGEPTKQYNMMLSAAYDAAHGTKEQRNAGKKRFVRTALTLAISGVVNAMAQSIMDAVRDDDKEEEYWEKWLAAFGENLVNTVNPAGYIPFVKDALSLLQGYDVSRMDMESIEKVLSAGQNMTKALNGEGKYTIGAASANLFAEVARMLGVPVSNMKREIKSFAMLVAVETDNYLMQYRMEKASLNLNYSSNSGVFMDILFNAYQNDKVAYNAIYKDMIKSGYDAEKLANGMETRMKKAQGVTKVGDLDQRYLHPNQQKKYDSKMSALQGNGLWSKATEEQRDNVESKLYGLVTGRSDDAQEKIDAGKNYDLDDTEYLLYQLALDMYDKPNDNGKYGTYSSEEKAAALLAADLGDQETAYLWGTDQALEALAAGVDMDNYVEFKGGVAGLVSGVDYKKGDTDSRKAAIRALLRDMGLSSNSYDYKWLWKTEYKN